MAGEYDNYNQKQKEALLFGDYSGLSQQEKEGLLFGTGMPQGKPQGSTKGKLVAGGKAGVEGNYSAYTPITEGTGDREADIRNLYTTLFGREPSQAGLDYWLSDGTPIGQLRDTLLQAAQADNSQDWQYFTGQTTDPFDPNAGTDTGQVDLGTGDPVVDPVVDPVIDTDTGTTGGYTEADVIALYQELFGRQPSRAGLDYWMQHAGQWDLDTLRSTMLEGAAQDDIDRYNTTPVPDPTETYDPDVENPYQPPDQSERTEGWTWRDYEAGAPDLEGGGGTNPNDLDYQWYVPGQESPWGNLGVEGGNKDFYKNQFNSLLADEQNFRNEQNWAKAIRMKQAQDKAAFDKANPEEPFTWEGKIDDVFAQPEGQGSGMDVATGEWRLNDQYGFTPETSNNEILRSMSNLSAFDDFDRQLMQGWLDDPAGETDFGWAGHSDPNSLIAAFGQDGELAPNNRKWMNTVANNLFTQGSSNAGGPAGMTTPAGYASPI